MRYFDTVVTAVSPEARELVEGGVLVLFADGAPPELAEVAVLHRVVQEPAAEAPAVGDKVTIGGLTTRITAIGELAWKKVREMGHIAINFNAADTAPRLGEISVADVDRLALAAALRPGVEIRVER